MSCNTCNQGCYTNPCNTCKTQSDCDCDLRLDYVPHTQCTISVTDHGCSDVLDLCPAIKACQTVTHMNWNDQTGCIEYENEKYVATDGAEGLVERICVSDFYPFINVCDLNDVICDEELEGTCYELVYRKNTDCDGCKSKDDHWEYFNHYSEGAVVDSFPYLKGEEEDGCPVYLDKPENCSFLVFSPSCKSPTGEWQAWQIPRVGQDNDCIVEPDEDGFYRVVVLDECGCPKECRLPVTPEENTVIEVPRDSVPDDPDYPWYYGNYNEKIDLHLKENAPTFFGKYNLKVTVFYGVQAIKSDKVKFNYNWRSILAPVVEGGDQKEAVEKHGSILQDWSMDLATEDEKLKQYQIPWGSSSLRGSFQFIVPKGKEAYLHHEYRIRTMDSVPTAENSSNDHSPEGYKTSECDGKRVPDEEATFNNVKWAASRLNALQVTIEPTQGAVNYDPKKDTVLDQLQPAVDQSPQAFGT